MPNDHAPSTSDGLPAAVTGRTTHGLDERGFVRDWLAGPAWSAPCTDLDQVLGAGGSPWGPGGRWTLTNGPDVAPLKRRLYARRPLVTDQPLPDPVEGGELRWVAPGGGRVDTGRWGRVHTGADGLVDWSRFCYTPEYRHAVAGTVLEVDQAEWRTLELACTGPGALWVGDTLVAQFDDVSYMEPVRHRVPVRLESGTTRIVLATWQVAFRECRHVAALRVLGLPVRVVLPSPGADEYASATAEQILDRVGSPRWALTEPVAELTGPPGAALAVAVAGPGSGRRVTRLRLDATGRGRIPLGSSTVDGMPGDAALDGDATASMLTTGETRLSVRVDDPRCPVFRTLHVAVLPHKRREAPVGDDPAAWRDELLRHVAAGQPGAARALAATALDPTAPVRAEDVAPGLAMVDSRADCADFEAVGLLHLWHRLAGRAWPEGLRERVAESLSGLKYWIDQPGLDAMCYFTENHQLVWHTAEILAGEAFPEREFRNTGWTGERHAEHGRALAGEWLRRKLAGGFSEFDSNAYLAIDSLALVSLVEYAADERLARLAEALLDKALLSLASNSWRGVHGAAHGRSYTQTLRSSRLEETAPIMWLLWGTGALNAAVLPATALATARVYRLPPLVRAVATEPPAEWDGRQVYRGTYRDRHDLLDRPYASDVRIWRTPAAMLSSVQDYRFGLPGLQEHIWGATLGSEVQVFATHPAASAHTSSARPNAWAGHRVLPRARQHRDTVLVLHRFPPDDPDPRTHLWFPASGMDEWVVAGPWLAGRVGDGFVAVAAQGGFEPVTAGETAWQEWWPRGDGRAYVATVADAGHGLVGDLAEFVASLAEPEFGPGPTVGWITRDGRSLRLDWSGPFTVDGRPADLDGDGRPETPPHLDNPACRVEFGVARLEARWAGHALVLDLAAGCRVEPASGVPSGSRPALTSAG
ncbi:hypothetical protein [Gandjariella thermophila]|uniref:Uncharacterized protein n=1 Tax=Gandjariella thermophila TaxID=1931992 RepID=A0A4D4JAR7_9PSEU|nr:hypothetical protein [Gandjariella thermophila]GDY31758.1 hypothetical protein GTS_33910 [Gandjariella thermophila]